MSLKNHVSNFLNSIFQKKYAINQTSQWNCIGVISEMDPNVEITIAICPVLSSSKFIKSDRHKCECGKCNRIVSTYYFEIDINDTPQKIIRVFKKKVPNYDTYF